MEVQKPKLVYFQFKYDESLPEFMLAHKTEHVACLRESFDVVVINEDCDYKRVCELHQPDLALFESGVNLRNCRRPRVGNVKSDNSIPKLGLHNGDAWCDTRAGFLSDMEAWGINTFFAISTTEREHLPEIAQHTFIWPNFINPSIYKDYKLTKVVPILFTGALYKNYPWRHDVFRILSEKYPNLRCPHFGYTHQAGPRQMLVGRNYAEALNASQIVPTCGTIAGELVRKHLEVPACNSCLLTEDSPALRAAGFSDMENCVFVTPANVSDRVDFLFRNPNKLAQITANGHDLVQSRHTIRHRDQILQWYRINKTKPSGTEIQQPNPFSPFVVRPVSSISGRLSEPQSGRHLELLRRGDRELWSGNYVKARELYYQSLGYIGWFAEPKMRLALVDLFVGRPDEALERLEELLRYTLVRYQADQPDPVEWAYFVVALLAIGKKNGAIATAHRFPHLSHPELNRIRAVLNHLFGASLPETMAGTRRHSIHQLPDRTFEGWLDDLCLMLDNAGVSDGGRLRETKAKILSGRPRISESTSNKTTLDDSSAPFLPANLRIKRRVRNHLRSFAQATGRQLNELERKTIPFLPYRISSLRKEEPYVAVAALAEDHRIMSAAILGAASAAPLSEAFVRSFGARDDQVRLFCAHRADRSNLQQYQRIMGRRMTALTISSEANFGEAALPFLTGLSSALEKDHSRLDVILIDFFKVGESIEMSAALQIIQLATFIVLFGTDRPVASELRLALLSDERYLTLNDNLKPEAYSIFRTV
ncbi:MAG TPA: glycosyltransferase [Verrucomicrobiae bacterium]